MMNKTFKYTYNALSSNERKEVECIKNEYLSSNTTNNKLITLKKLDNKVKQTPIIISLTLGIIFTLVFGGGLALILEFDEMLIGMILVVSGIIFICVNYFIYKLIFNYLKSKYSSTIISLSDEILNTKE